MKLDSYNIIRRPIITEKGMAGVERKNQYPFEVAVGANKEEIKRAVQEVFSVRVVKVRTMIRRGKPRGHRTRRSYTREWKRAVVTLAPGENIEFI